MTNLPTGQTHHNPTGGTPYHCTYFYVGGQYVDNEQGKDQHVLTGQMYVEQLTPVGGPKHDFPVVFIPGAGQTGTVSCRFFFV